jgi:hypothetical protein
MPHAGRSVRRARALGSVLLWGLGLHVLPLLHNLEHRDDHTHGPGGPGGAYRQGDDRIGHGHGHDYDRPHAHPAVPPSDTSELRLPGQDPGGTDPDHGLGSVLHFAAAIAGSDPMATPGPGPTIDAVLDDTRTPAPFRPLRLLPARGPPSTHA